MLICLLQCIAGYRAEEAVEMLKTFYKQENPNGKGNLFNVSMIMSIDVFIDMMFFFSHLLAPKPKVRKDLNSPPGGAVVIQVNQGLQDEKRETIAPLS